MNYILSICHYIPIRYNLPLIISWMKFKLQKAHLEIANKNWDGKSSGIVVHNVAHVVTFNWKRKWCSFKNLLPFV